MELKTFLWILFILYLGVLAYLTYIGTKRTRNISDFAIAGSALGPYVAGLCFAATFLSAATFMGHSGWSYTYGYTVLWIPITLIGAGSIGFLVVARKARDANLTQKSLSLADWLGDYYQSDYMRLGVALVSLFNVFYIAGQLAACAWVFNVVMGVSYTTGLTIATTVLVVYVMFGGTFADVYTDAVQGVLMAIMGVIVFIAGVNQFGSGLTESFTIITNKLATQDPDLVGIFNPKSPIFYGPLAIVGMMIIQFAFANQPQLFNKFLALEKPQDMAKMLIVHLITITLCLFVVFSGIFLKASNIELPHADQAVLIFLRNAFNPFLAAGLSMIILAAAMSTTDGIFIVLSVAISNDIYRKFLVKRGIIKYKSEVDLEKSTLLISRIAVIGVGIAAWLLVVNPPKLLSTFLWIGLAGVGAGSLGPLVGAVLFKRKIPTRAAEISVVAGFLGYLFLMITKIEKSVLAAGGWGVVIGVLVILVATIFSKNGKKEE